jgi:Fuc2NAc and GlcNAc transferase
VIAFTTFIITVFSSYFGVAWFERWSRKRELLDIPNDRSSHEVPTPRGAGLVIVAICIVIYVASALTFSGRITWSYLFGAILIAAISWLDDVRSVSFVVRFFIHSIAAIAVIAN